MNKISVVKCEKYSEELVYKAIKKSMENIFNISEFFEKGKTVALKPNFVMGKNPVAGATTHPFVIAAIGRILIENGLKVKVVESPGGPYTKAILRKVYKTCGIIDICNKYNIELNYDTSVKSVKVVTDLGTRSLTILKPLIDADYIISLPKLKTHAMMTYTGAIKNMFGSIAGIEKAAYHVNSSKYPLFANQLIDIYLASKPNLSIMDAIVGMDGKGPTSGNPKKIGLIITGVDGFAMDSLCHDIVKINKGKSYVMFEASKRNIDLEYELVGESLNDIIIDDFEVPYEYSDSENKTMFKFLYKTGKSKPVVDAKKCVGCQICIQNCPAGVMKLENKIPVINYKKCIRCFCCQELCPKSAIDVKQPILIKLLTRRKK